MQDMTNEVVRKQLIMMLNWKVGILADWSVSTGKSSKYLYRWLSEEEWQMFLATYFDCNVDHAWQAVFKMCTLFETTAQYVGEKLGWEYHKEEGRAARSYLESVYQMAKDQ